MGVTPETVVEDALDVVDEDDEGDYVTGTSTALEALRRVYSQRY